jgi:hypothetical protein
MAGEVSIVSIDERDRWEAEHAEDGLPTQSWRYAWALSASGLEPKLAVVRAGGSRMLMPFFEREWMGSTDIATLLGLSGASIAPSSMAPLAQWREYAIAQGWVAGYIQLAASVALPAVTEGDELVTSNEVFFIDLRVADLLRRMSNIVRRKIRRAERSGVSLVVDRSLLSAALQRL